MTFPNPTTTLTASLRPFSAKLPGETLSLYPEDMSLPKRSWLRAALGIAGTVAAGWMSYILVPGRETGLPDLRSSTPSPDLMDFVTAAGTARPTPGRLAAGLAYASYDAASKAPSVSSRLARLEAELRIKKRAEAPSASAADLGAQATVDLVYRRFGQAIRRLERAAALAPDDAGPWNDLAAVLMGQAESEAEPFGLVRALAAADQAMAVDPRFPTARFNRALALQSLFLTREAQYAWQAYLELDGDSEWAAEARQHLARLEAPEDAEPWAAQREALRRAALGGDDVEAVRSRVMKDPQWAREDAEEVLLARAAELLSPEPGPEAAEALKVARAVARVLAAEYGERMLWDSLDVVEQARSGEQEARRFALLKGHRHFRKGMDFYDRDESGEARAAFREAGDELTRGGSPYAAWAAFYVANCDFRARTFPSATALLEELRPQVDGRRNPVLLARIDHLRGLLQLIAGHPMRSLTIFQAARKRLYRAGLPQEAAFLHTLIAENYDYLGQSGEAWIHRYQGLASTPDIPDKDRLHAVFNETANAVQRAGEPGVALYFRDEVVRIAQALPGERTGLPFALLRRAETRHRLGKDEEALQDLAAAQRHVRLIPGAEERRREETTLNLARGEILLEARPREALDALTAALGPLRETGVRMTMIRLYLARARGYRLIGRDALAQLDLERGIEIYESDRAQIDEEWLRRSYFEQAQELFDEQIRLHWRHPAERLTALEYSERKRSRELLDLMGSASPNVRPLTPDALRSELPPGTTLVEYSLLEDRVFAWIVRFDRIVPVELPASAAQVEEQVGKLRGLLRRNASAEELRPFQTALYEALVRDVTAEMPAQDLLVVVPDQGLHLLAFAALVNPETGRFLLEEHPLVVAPSATFYVGASRAGASVGAPSALLLGDPAIRRDLHPSLSPLRAAAAAVERIGAFYPRSRTLTGKLATARGFLEAAGQHQVVHFAGHALTNPEVPSMSRLLMAPEAGSDLGILYARDIRRARFASTRLVVLAACDSASGPVSSTEGALNLARPFLLAGVDATVASLWQVDDAATAGLFIRFHRELTAGADAARALRTAQLALLEASSPEHGSPSHWAAFQLIGRAVTLDNP